MAVKSANEVAKKWAERLQNSKKAIEDGVRSVTVSPTHKAAAKADKYVAGVQRSVEEGRFQKGLMKVTNQDWQQSMLVKGLPRLAAGVTQAIPKMETFLTDYLPFVQSVQAQVQAMPNDTQEERIERMVANARGLARYKRK